MKLKNVLIIITFPYLVYGENSFDVKGLVDFDAIKIEKVQKKENKESKFYEFLTKNVSGGLGYGQNQGTDESKRSYAYAELGLKYTYNDWLHLNLSGIAESIRIKILQKKVNNYSSVIQPDKRIAKYNKDQIRLVDAYFKADIGEYFSLSAGKKKIVWGQFEPFSPNNFAMPLNMSSTGSTFSKVIGTLSQRHLSLSYYPNNRVTFEGYFFPEITSDAVLDEEFSSDETYYKGNDSFSDIDRRPKGSDEHQFGARLMFYPDWGIVGFTYFKGYDSNFPMEQNKLALDSTKYYVEGGNGYSKNNLIGFEIAIPNDNWTYLFELSKYKKETELEGFYLNNTTAKEISNRYSSEYNKYFNWVKNKNNNKLWVPIDSYIAAIGADVKWENWKLKFGLYFLKDIYSGSAKEGFDLSKENGSLEEEELEIYPTFSLLREYSTSKWGLAGGILGNGIGILTYYEKTFFEDLAFTVGLNYIEYYSDDTLGDTDNEGASYESESSFGLLTGVRYQF